MTGRRSEGLLLLLMRMMMVLLDSTSYVWMLPAPSSVSVESVNMRHILRWRPPQAACSTTLLYFVQFQGEFELVVLNGSWVEAAECQWTPHTHCDLTFDLGSDSDYNLKVRAQCGAQLSPWTQLSPPFNRRDTILTAPQMVVAAVGDALQVSFQQLPLTAVVMVKVWRKEYELQAAVYSLPAERLVLHIAALQEGATYCVRAHTVLNSEIHSSSTDTQCVSITVGADGAWKKTTTVTVTVIIMVSLLVAVFWSLVHCRPHVCHSYFHKEPLPDSLKLDRDIQILMSPEEAELCEAIQVSADPDN